MTIPTKYGMQITSTAEMGSGSISPADFKGTSWTSSSFSTSIDTSKDVFKITLSNLKASKFGVKNLNL